MERKNIKFYSLLYVQKGAENLAQNFGAASSKPPKIKDLELYTKSCSNLKKSLEAQGFCYSVLTNQPELLKKMQPELDVKEIDFSLNVPEGISFYGAHFKIDTFKWFAAQKDDYSILLDIDEVCINPMPENLCAAIKQNLPVYYDITDQMYPDAGRARLIDDLKLFCPEADLGIWAGGEFIGGDSAFFKKLYKKIDAISAGYFASQQKLFHKGDESLTTAALQCLLKDGTPMVNAGGFGAVVRYWSCGTRHIQKPFAAVKDCFLLHLPADKRFLAENSYDSGFIQKYEKYLRSEKSVDTKAVFPKLFWQRVKNKLLRLAKLKR
ncbi:MAG: hypothetical protein J5798_04820 [Spirochaetaceae bacterium]|nr:hypothetical protein [Spirochaetaceae bacterium]